MQDSDVASHCNINRIILDGEKARTIVFEERARHRNGQEIKPAKRPAKMPTMMILRSLLISAGAESFKFASASIIRRASDCST